MKKILTHRRIFEGERLPRGYRVAYIDLARLHDVAYPIGIHLIARLVRRTWEWSFYYQPSRLEQMVLDAEHRGRKQEQEYRDELSENERRKISELAKVFTTGLKYDHPFSQPKDEQ